MFQFLPKFFALIVATGVLLPAQQSVWFTPIPYATHPDGLFGSTDYLSLFSPTAPWQQAASQVQVFKLYGTDNFSDSDLSNLIANLKQRNIALALEWPVLSSSTCGDGIEGFGGSPVPVLQRIQSLGGVMSYLAMEQPYQWGSLYAGANSCQWTAAQVAVNALATVNQAKSVFPNLQVGDISAVPPFQNLTSSWVPQYALWFDTWRSVSGSPLAFFHVDVDWTVPNWQAAVAAVRPAVEQRGIAFGIVYNGFLTNQSDSAWMSAAEDHFVDFEVTNGQAPPAEVDFQSWNPNPTHVLPETDPTAFTYLIDRYTRTRTNLAVATDGAQVIGKLTAGTAPVAGASVLLTSQPTSGSGSVATYTITGPVPTQARTAIVGARMNSECYSCIGPTDLTVYTFQYSDDQGATGEWDFTHGFLIGWLFNGGTPVVVIGPPPYAQGLQATGSAGQAIGLNSTNPIAVNPGAQFTFQVAARVSPLSAGTGYFTLIWFDANGNEPSRETILFEPQGQTLSAVTTAADGSFSLPTSVDPNQNQVTAQYAGSSTLWPSTATTSGSSASTPPSIVSLNPSAASGASVTFSAAFSDSGGWANIANAEMLINATQSTQAGCVVSYLPSTGTFQLLNDAGTAWSSIVRSNSQCSLSGATASAGGNNLTLTFTLNFSATFASSGFQKSLYLQATDSHGLLAPWSAAGTLSLPPAGCTQPPTASVANVQSIVNQVLGIAPATTDLNGDGQINVLDIQFEIDSALGCATAGSAAVNSGARTALPVLRKAK